MKKKIETPRGSRRRLLAQAKGEKFTERMVAHSPPSLKLALAAYAIERTRETGEQVTSGSIIRGLVRKLLAD